MLYSNLFLSMFHTIIRFYQRSIFLCNADPACHPFRLFQQETCCFTSAHCTILPGVLSNLSNEYVVSQNP